MQLADDVNSRLVLLARHRVHLAVSGLTVRLPVADNWIDEDASGHVQGRFVKQLAYFSIGTVIEKHRANVLTSRERLYLCSCGKSGWHPGTTH